MKDLVGRKLGGRFEVLRPLGAESLGEVYAARDLGPPTSLGGGRLVRVKVVPATVDGERFARFAREMKASFLVAHKNTVEVLELGEDAGNPPVRWLATEWLVAHPLADELAKGALPWRRASVLAAQIASALGAAHQEGIVHRALSPACVLLLDNADGDYAKVRDFGFARLDDETGQLTARDARLGALEYMAPEHVETGAFGPKSDLYALGALWFHLVAGRPPFTGDAERLMDQHLRAEPPRLSSLRPETPAWLDELVAALLSKDPSARPGVYRIVQRVEDEVGLALPTPWPIDADGRAVRPAPPPAERPGVGAWVTAAVALGLVGGLGIAAVLAGTLALLAYAVGAAGG